MQINNGVNRVFLLGTIDDHPNWQLIDQKRVLYFRLVIVEPVKRGDLLNKHVEIQYIKVPAGIVTKSCQLLKDDLVYVQGKLQTRQVYNRGIKLYNTEVLATSVEIISR